MTTLQNQILNLFPEDERKDLKNKPEVWYTGEGLYEINTYKFLYKRLGTDYFTDQFNKLKCDAWDCDVYGISQKQKDWLIQNGFKFGETINTYNDPDLSYSHLMQYTKLYRPGEDTEYILLQIHHGGDARINRTDAKLFVWLREFRYAVEGVVYWKNGGVSYVNDGWNGYQLAVDTEDEGVTEDSLITEDKDKFINKVELKISEDMR